MMHPSQIVAFVAGIAVTWGVVAAYRLAFPCAVVIQNTEPLWTANVGHPLMYLTPADPYPDEIPDRNLRFPGVSPMSRRHVAFQSQKGQDQWVVDVLRGRTGGYFVDLAANEPVKFSNTYYLEQTLNWTGLCIEANHQYFWALVSTRQCQVVAAVVDAVDGGEVSFRTDLGAGGGIVAPDTDNNYLLRGKGKLQINPNTLERFPTSTLATLLRENGSPRVIDYMSLDIEGAEWRALAQFPFDEYTFLTMTIERPTPELNELLFSQGYIYVKTDAHKSESFYVHDSLPWIDDVPKERFVQVPKKTN